MANFQLRAYMNYDVRPTEQWTNTLEYVSTEPPSSPTWEAAVSDYVIGLQAMLLDNVFIDRVVLSTWEPDSRPYDAEALRTFPIGEFGSNPFLLTTPVDDDIVLFMRKSVLTGRTGKIQLRGVLTMSQIEVVSGSWTLIASARTFIEGNAALFYTGASSYFELYLIGSALQSITYPATAEGEIQVPIKNYAAAPTTRLVTGFVVVDPRERQDTQ